jgi:hypothetical protein
VYAKRANIPADLVVEPHAVLVVGWDDDAGWWLVRNSWGSWPGGSKPGFFKVRLRGQQREQWHCRCGSCCSSAVTAAAAVMRSKQLGFGGAGIAPCICSWCCATRNA